MLTVVLAGCAKKDEPLTQESLLTGILSGVVTDVTLAPLAGVNVTVADGVVFRYDLSGTAVPDGDASMLTDAAGAFHFVLDPGEHLLVARLEGYVNAAVRANVLASQAVATNITLAPVPKESPRVEVQEGKGLIGCALVVSDGNAPQEHACPSQDANARPTIDFHVGDVAGLAGAVVELDWEAASQGSKTLALRISVVTGGSEEALAHVEGAAPLSATLPARILDSKIASGSALRVTVSPAGSFTDDEAGIDAGAAVQQAFTAYASLFYHEAPEGGYTVLQS